MLKKRFAEISGVFQKQYVIGQYWDLSGVKG